VKVLVAWSMKFVEHQSNALIGFDEPQGIYD